MDYAGASTAHSPPDAGALDQLPRPTPEPPPIVEPRDVAYPGVLTLEIDATDTGRGIISARQLIPVDRAGPMTLLYPKWIPGYHSPQNPLELLAGLEIRAGGEPLHWRRDPVEMYAFHLDVPQGAWQLEARFQFLSPTNSSQGEVVVTTDLLNLQWGRMLLYPAGHYSRQIRIAPRLTLPEGWRYATVLEGAKGERSTITFETVSLDVLVDSPLMAGPHLRETPLDEAGAVVMALFAHDPSQLQATEVQLDPHRALVAQTDRLFGSRHYDRYRFLVALSDELGGGGVEHHRSAEIVAPPNYFTDWEPTFTSRSVFGHEFTHSWNGKFRRGADSWTPSFERPIRNSLMWVYEGQTQYWGHVLTARSGLWSMRSALESLAKIAATYDVRPGGMWRTMADTTRDPIIVARAPLPWPSWQRNEDYYSEGQLMWLDVDTLIRERSGDQRSLDDFARAFFGVADGGMETLTYVRDETVDAEPVMEAIQAGHAPGLERALAAAARLDDILLYDQVTRLGSQTAYERVAHFLLELQHRSQMAGLGDLQRFPMPLTQEMLADALGLSIVHVNRTLQQLRLRKMIELRSGAAVLLDREALISVADFRWPKSAAKRT